MGSTVKKRIRISFDVRLSVPAPKGAEAHLQGPMSIIQVYRYALRLSVSFKAMAGQPEAWLSASFGYENARYDDNSMVTLIPALGFDPLTTSAKKMMVHIKELLKQHVELNHIPGSEANQLLEQCKPELKSLVDDTLDYYSLIMEQRREKY